MFIVTYCNAYLELTTLSLLAAQNFGFLHFTKSIYECQDDNLLMFSLSWYSSQFLLLQDSLDEQFDLVC